MEEQALKGVIPPIVATLFFLLIAWRPWKRSGTPNGAWGSALGLAIGYAIADILVRGTHTNLYHVFPRSGSNWHPYIAVATGALIAALSSYKKIGARLPVSILLTALASTLYFRSMFVADWKGTLPAIGIATAVGLFMWMGVWSAAHKATGARIPLMLWAAATGSALILLQSHNLALAQMAGALAASMGVFILLGWLRPSIPAVTAAIPVYILVMLGLFIVARGFMKPWETAHWSIALAAVAVASPGLTLLPPFRKLKPWLGTLAGLLLTLAISAIGLALTPSGFDFSELK